MGLAFGSQGASVAINARTPRVELRETVQKICSLGAECIPLVGDVTDRKSVDQMIAEIDSRFGRLDILINNAVTHSAKPFVELSFAEWDSPIRVCLDGCFHCSQAAIPLMSRSGGGSIINMGGLFGHMPVLNRAATAAAKAGLAGLTRALALELAALNINVNYVAPGPANTERTTPFSFDITRIPMRRFGEPDEVVNAVMMLCGPHGRYITGQTLHVNGGLYMNN
jgi:3-oxoacyl-[acyl-carrier protein] reductase